MNLLAAGTSKKLIPSVGGIVIGHFSVDGPLKDDHCNFKASHNMFIVEDPSTTLDTPPVCLHLSLIKKFSFPGQTVVEANGTGQCTSNSYNNIKQ